MASVKISDRINAPADRVWDLVGDFGGIGRFSKGFKSVASTGSGVGAIRTITLPNDVELQERCELLDAARRTLDYSIVAGPLPVSGYLARIQLFEDGEGTRIEWSSTFEPKGIPEAQAVAMIEGVYKGGIAGIKRALAPA
ncbi:MAG TPA: SRPBCC family protein [Myxococcota bacterium]|nr:SRPBCC family protein [Myxococcota bacterium]